MSALPVEPVEVPGVVLASINSVWSETMHRHTYDTEPAMLDAKGRRIGWHAFFTEMPGPDGTRFRVTVQHLRAGQRYGPGTMPTDALTYAEARTYLAELLAASLKRYKKLAAERTIPAPARAGQCAHRERMPEPEPRPFQRYDVLECSDDAGQTWQSFSTIRDRSDCAYSIAIVDTDGASQGFSRPGRTFRVRCSSWSDGVRYARGMRAPALPAGELP